MKPTPPRATRARKDPRTPAGSSYGDVVPTSPRRDPSKGAELERDAMPPDGDFSAPPPGSAADTSAGHSARPQRRVHRVEDLDGPAEPAAEPTAKR